MPQCIPTHSQYVNMAEFIEFIILYHPKQNILLYWNWLLAFS